MATHDEEEKTTLQPAPESATTPEATVDAGSPGVTPAPVSATDAATPPEATVDAGSPGVTPARPSAFEQIRQSVSEDDDAPVGSLTLRKILGGDILSAQMVRSQIWLLLLIVFFITVSVAFRYQCQQDLLEIAQLEKKLTDVKYKALASSSQLTERCRESHVLEMLRQNKDSMLHISTQPPYIVTVPEE